MVMTLADGEPAAGPWRAATVAELVDLLVEGDAPAGRPRVVAVDGRSAGGKSTLARRLHEAVPSSVVLHTDDIAWHHSFFDWHDLLADEVLTPVRRGHEVRYRPPAWEERGRPGSIDVPAGLDLVVVEGVGAGRRQLAHLLDAVVWLQSDVVEAERRGIARDVAEGRETEQATAFWHEWMAAELPFLEQERPWERAGVIVCGTPPQPSSDGEVWLAPPP